MSLIPRVVRSFRTCICTNYLLQFQVLSESTSIDLPRATRLKDVTFQYGLRNIDWITMVLQTITPEHRYFRQITIVIPCPEHTSVSTSTRKRPSKTRFVGSGWTSTNFSSTSGSRVKSVQRYAQWGGMAEYGNPR